MYKINDCDYLKTQDGNFYIVKGYSYMGKKIPGTMVFSPSKKGKRNNIDGKNYSKTIQDKVELIDPEKVIKIYEPQKSKVKTQLTGIWKDIYESLLDIGINDDSIGIIGSSLIGFLDYKDIDFIVYGIDNMQKLKQNIKKIRKNLNVTKISGHHIAYQQNKYSKWHSSNANNFNKLLLNKWSSLQIKKGLLTTIRFAFKPTEIPEIYLKPISTVGEAIVLQGEVIEDIFTNFNPRLFKFKTSRGEVYTTITMYWSYQACVSIGQEIEVTATLIEKDGKLLNLHEYNHGIKIL